jgi:actin-like ATPase involved in cell morphogenesis
VVQEGRCVYGKFFAGKAGVVSLDWWPHLMGWRRSQHPKPASDSIEQAILDTLSATPPELAADIYRTGIYLAGGGSLLRGLDQRISSKTKLQVHIAEDPLRAVARGTGIALKNFNKFSFLIR